jgi:hypothetical protein
MPTEQRKENCSRFTTFLSAFRRNPFLDLGAPALSLHKAFDYSSFN